MVIVRPSEWSNWYICDSRASTRPSKAAAAIVTAAVVVQEVAGQIFPIRIIHLHAWAKIARMGYVATAQTKAIIIFIMIIVAAIIKPDTVGDHDVINQPRSRIW